jgi:hypothetical protein
MMRRIIGLLFVGLSIVLSFANLSFTGAVVGLSTYPVSVPLMSLILLVFGIFLLIHRSEGLEEIIKVGVLSPSDAANRLNRIPGERGVIVVDTSFVGDYNRAQVSELFEGLGTKYSEIIVPGAVIDELRRGPRRENISALNDSPRTVGQPPNYVDFISVATEYLSKSGKKLARDRLVPIITGKMAPPKSRAEAAPLVEEVKKIMGWIRNDGLPLNKENIVRVLDRHYEVSVADVEVLASALAIARANPSETVVVAGRDRDFRYAIDLMKNGGEGLRPYELGKRLVYCSSQAREE